MAEKIGTISNRVFIKKLDQALQNGSISKKEYDSIKKEYFGKPKLIQMDLFDPDKKKQGGLMEATKRLKAQGLKSGGKAKKRPKKAGPPSKKTGPTSPIGPVPRMPRGMTNQEKLDMINKMKKDQGKMVDESLKVDNFGNFYYEVKKGGRIKKFPDLSGDGKVTMKDILMGRGVIKKPQKKNKGGFTGRAGIAFDADNKLRRALKSIDESDAAFKRKKNRERMIRRRRRLSGAALGLMGAVKGVLKGAGKVAGRAAKRGYGIAKK